MARPPGASLRDRFRYAIDNSLAKGVWVILVWMAIALSGAVIVIGVLIWAFGAGPGDRPVPLLEGIWIALTRSLDPGTFGGDVGAHFRVAALAITVIGLLAIALLIGIVANAVTQRLDELRQGRSLVLEAGHTLILGYSSKLALVVRELIEARASDASAAIVILSPHDKVELEAMLRREIRHTRVRVIVRRGEPSSLLQLMQGQPAYARNIVILRPDEHDADAEVIKVVLAVCKVRMDLERIPIVAELQDAGAARGLRQALPGQVITVVTGEVVARIAAQTSRAAGLGTLYQELLDFNGDEVYLATLPGHLIGRRFADSLLASRNCTVLGVMREDGAAVLCPDMDTVLGRNEHLIVLAADDSAIAFDSPAGQATLKGIESLSLREARAERCLIVGWNAMAPRIAAELDRHVASGSRLHILMDERAPERFSSQEFSHLANQRVTVQRGSMIDRGAIDEAISHGPYDHILVLCQHEGSSALEADARALLALLHVRNALQFQGASAPRTNVVTEVLQSEAVELAQVAQPDDYIVSQRLVSLLIAQLAEDPRRKPILFELLDSKGAQIILYPVEDADLIGDFTFAQVVECFRGVGAIAIGWQAESMRGHGSTLRGGMRINPRKDESVRLQEGDQIILLMRADE